MLYTACRLLGAYKPYKLNTTPTRTCEVIRLEAKYTRYSLIGQGQVVSRLAGIYYSRFAVYNTGPA
jgi:hypothetical protein